MKYFILFFLILFLLGCAQETIEEPSMNREKGQIRYIPLGDSYTIGTGTIPQNAWPVLLTKHLQEEGIDIILVDNPARNAQTTQYVLDVELPLLVEKEATFSTLMIGVNDYVQRVGEETFRSRLSAIMDRMIDHLSEKNIVVITIPDFSITPVGKNFGRDSSEGVARFNEIIKEEASKRNLPVVDLYPYSQTMTEDLISEDLLHPNGEGYAKWEELIFPIVKEALS